MLEEIAQSAAQPEPHWFFLATGHWQLGAKDEARKWYDRAVQWMEKNAAKDEELRRFRVVAAELLKITKNEP